ncbi:HAMP domain-containing sensor histidine kinase [Novosphingobium sp. SG707]|uniref:ATP-binding protein n=1 Tax=Novosphingobium sp. SG707 TaxID=2586996 RepID=UPI0014477D24|nr:HAMP domain-containing sensor histidine kinase [Novosphingobium sp. SG707]NKI99460.1 signal transduction histidine kinase [Novosphingobium sp. SG707]
MKRVLIPARFAAHSLRLRFLLAILLWVALGIGGIWYSATRVFTRHIEAQYHDELYGHVRELAGLVNISKDSHLSLSRPLSDPRYLEPMSGYYWQVSVHKGDRIHSASMVRGVIDEDIAHSPEIFHSIDNGPTGKTIAYGFTGFTPDGRIVHYVIAVDKRYLDQAIASFTRELTLWLTALAAALLITGYAVVMFGLRPLNRLATAIGQLREGTSARLEGAYPSEIAPLVEDLNAYIAGNEAVIERARVEAGNLAHGLRTPLAVITDEAERLARQPESARAARALLDQAHVMVQQIDFRLARTRSAAGARASLRVSHLPEAVLPILSAMRKLHPDCAFDLSAPAPVRMAIDPVDLSELVSNLLDNAGKWARRRVVLTIAEGPRIRVEDDGPGMSEEQIARACEIGSRFDADMPGSGLGLAIARDIAEAYGLRLRLSSPPGGGLVAELT